MKIERNIPVPTTPTKPRSERVPIESMDVGDSVFLPGKSRVSANAICMGTAMRAGLKFAFKTAAEGDGARVWRVR